MIVKPRSESDELLTLRALSARMELTDREKFHYLNLEKGYEGELLFDQMAESLLGERYILNDLLLQVNNSYVQIDSLLISQGGILLVDIKNYQGDCYYKSDKLFSVTTEREWKNPVDQLKRSATLLRQLLQSLKFNYLVEAFVIFINKDFTLYQAPLEQPLILPTQVNKFLTNLNKTPSTLNETHKKLAQTLLSLHQQKNPFVFTPDFQYEQLQKGVYCKKCSSFLIEVRNEWLVCKKCGEIEKTEDGVLRNVKEYKLLFPGEKITTNSVNDWCRLNVSKKTIYRILKKHYVSYGSNKYTYYK